MCSSANLSTQLVHSSFKTSCSEKMFRIRAVKNQLEVRRNMVKFLKLTLLILLSKNFEYPWFSLMKASYFWQWSWNGVLKTKYLKHISSK